MQLRKPFRTSQGSVTTRRVFVLVLQDDEGHAGYGEAAPLPAFGGEDPLTCREALDLVLEQLPAFAQRWIIEDRPQGGLGTLERILRHAPCARSCVEGALLDLVAQRKGISVAALLAGDGHIVEKLPVNAVLTGTDSDEIAEAASRLVAGGWRSLKLKVGADHLVAARMVETLREWVGDRVAIRVDANGAWDLPRATAFLKETAACKLEYLEQPLPADDIDGMAQLCRLGLAPIAADESVRDASSVGRIAAKQAADIVIVKPMALGGWRPTQQVVKLAQDTGIDVVLTTFLDGSIGRAITTHMAAVLNLQNRAQGLGTGPLLATDLTDRPLPVRDGSVIIPEEPGLGIGTLLPELLTGA
ncbi:MAG: o-succinylbenzoate synthase [Planctomycetota bacterium]|nr:o-succinylbenzoate synthase [Planctomycetota bacterium]